MEQLKITLPIFSLIGIGYISRVLIKKQNWTVQLNRFVYYISLPALIVFYFSQLEWSGDVLGIIVFNCIVLAISAIILLPISLLITSKKPLQAAFFLTSIVSNSIYLGIPLAQRAYGDGTVNAIAISSVIQLVGGILLSVVAIEYFFLRSNNIRSVIKHVINNPLFIGVLIGLAFMVISNNSWYGSTIEIPIKMLAATASPVALFALGSFMYGHVRHKHLYLVIIATVVKLLVYPFIAFVLARAVHISSEDAGVTIMMCAMPTAVTAFVLSQKYKLDSAFVANTMLLSTLASVAISPVWLSAVK